MNIFDVWFGSALTAEEVSSAVTEEKAARTKKLASRWIKAINRRINRHALLFNDLNCSWNFPGPVREEDINALSLCIHDLLERGFTVEVNAGRDKGSYKDTDELQVFIGESGREKKVFLDIYFE